MRAHSHANDILRATYDTCACAGLAFLYLCFIASASNLTAFLYLHKCDCVCVCAERFTNGPLLLSLYNHIHHY